MILYFSLGRDVGIKCAMEVLNDYGHSSIYDASNGVTVPAHHVLLHILIQAGLSDLEGSRDTVRYDACIFESNVSYSSKVPGSHGCTCVNVYQCHRFQRALGADIMPFVRSIGDASIVSNSQNVPSNR